MSLSNISRRHASGSRGNIFRANRTRSETITSRTRSHSTQTVSEDVDQTYAFVSGSSVKDFTLYCFNTVARVVSELFFALTRFLFNLSAEEVVSVTTRFLRRGLQFGTRTAYTALEMRLALILTLLLASIAYSILAPYIAQCVYLVNYVMENFVCTAKTALTGIPKPRFKLRVVHSGNFKNIQK